MFAVFLVFLFLLRIVTAQGWYIVTYALGIYHLNLFIAFLTPKIDPALDLDGEFRFLLWRDPLLYLLSLQMTWGPNCQLNPTKNSGRSFDGKAFVIFCLCFAKLNTNKSLSRLPEFKFWLSVSKSTLIGIFCTFFDAFNVPVFWPILVMYFITLFCITMKRQIKVSVSPFLVPNKSLSNFSFLQHMIKYRYLPFTHGKPRYQQLNQEK